MPLYQQQIDFVLKARRLARILNTSPYGTGKTPAAVVRLKELVPPQRALLVVPNSKIDDWLFELKRWGNPRWIVGILGGHRIKRRVQRVQALRKPHHIGIINPEGVLVLGSLLCEQYGVLAVDEVHTFKNPYGQVSRALSVLSEQAQYVIGMTGSPVTEHLVDLYALFRIANPAMVDRTFEPWRERYFVYESRHDELGRKQYPKWHAKDGTLEALTQALHAISYRCERKDLPVEWPVEVDSPPIRPSLHLGERQVYESMEKDCRVLLKNVDVTVDNVRPKLQKLLQICSGWMYNEHGKAIILGPSAKLEAVTNHIEEIRHQGRLLLWSVYPPEIVLLGRVLSRMGITHALCHGKVPMKDRERAKASFNYGNIEAIVANPDIWGPGVNLYAEFATTYSRDWSGDTHLQKRGRPIRADSKQDRVVFTEIVARDTVDAGCLAALVAKKDLLDVVFAMRTIPRG